jgi:crotonobetainyl-CoA:carnitine CoA-transferase CaiB-like acyl-CoA transferase
MSGALDVKLLIDDPRFKTPQGRSKNRLPCNAKLQKVTVTKTSADWGEIFNEAGVPWTILNVKDMFEDEQVPAQPTLRSAAEFLRPLLWTRRVSRGHGEEIAPLFLLDDVRGRGILELYEIGDHGLHLVRRNVGDLKYAAWS